MHVISWHGWCPTLMCDEPTFLTRNVRYSHILQKSLITKLVTKLTFICQLPQSSMAWYNSKRSLCGTSVDGGKPLVLDGDDVKSKILSKCY